MNIYEVSIQALKDLDNKISVKEWNRIADRYNYLSTKSLLRLSNCNNFLELQIKIRSK